jgi:hypothetical protein
MSAMNLRGARDVSFHAGGSALASEQDEMSTAVRM